MKVITLDCGCVLLADDAVVQNVAPEYREYLWDTVKQGNVLVLKDCGTRKIRLIIPDSNQIKAAEITGVVDLAVSSVAYDIFRFARIMCEGNNRPG